VLGPIVKTVPQHTEGKVDPGNEKIDEEMVAWVLPFHLNAVWSWKLIHFVGGDLMNLVLYAPPQSVELPSSSTVNAVHTVLGPLSFSHGRGCVIQQLTVDPQQTTGATNYDFLNFTECGSSAVCCGRKLYTILGHKSSSPESLVWGPEIVTTSCPQVSSFQVTGSAWRFSA